MAKPKKKPKKVEYITPSGELGTVFERPLYDSYNQLQSGRMGIYNAAKKTFRKIPEDYRTWLPPFNDIEDVFFTEEVLRNRTATSNEKARALAGLALPTIGSLALDKLSSLMPNAFPPLEVSKEELERKIARQAEKKQFGGEVTEKIEDVRSRAASLGVDPIVNKWITRGKTETALAPMNALNAYRGEYKENPEQELAYFENLLSRAGQLSDEQIVQLADEDKNLVDRYKLLRQLPIYKEDVDSLYKYAPIMMEKFNPKVLKASLRKAPKMQFGGEVKVGKKKDFDKDAALKANPDYTGVPLSDIFTLSADMSEQAQLQAAEELLNRKNQVMWANYTGNWQDYPVGKPPRQFKYTPAILADMEKRGITKEYIESWQPENYPEEFALGGSVDSEQLLNTTGNDVLGSLGGIAGGYLGDQMTEGGSDTLGGMVEGAMGGIGGGIPGMAIGAILGGVQSWQDQQKNDPILAAQTKKRNDAKLAALEQASAQSQYAPTFCRGGKVRKMPMGGMIPYEGEQTQVVEVETGEPFRTPDGSIGVIKDDEGLSHKNGGVTIPLEVGTQILGKGKDPDTKMTYKDLGKKLAMQKKKYDKILDSTAGTYSVNAAKAMNAKIDNKFQTLFAKQEAAKAPKAPQPEIPKAQFGLGVGQPLWEQFQMMQGMSPYPGVLAGAEVTGNAPAGVPWREGWGPQQPQQTQQSAVGGGNQAPISNSPAPIVGAPVNASQMPEATSEALGLPGGLSDSKFGRFMNPDNISLSGAGVAGPSGAQRTGLTFDQLGTAAQLAPVAYNLIQGLRPSQQLNARDFYNPQYGRAIGLMQNRKYDIDPVLEGNLRAYKTGLYNLKHSGPSAGQLYSGIQGLAASRMRADMAARSQKSNIENQYRAQEAAMRAGLGGQRAAMNYQVTQDNLAAEAARRGHLGASMTGISDYAQMQQLMQGQERQSAAQLEALQGMYARFGQWFPGVEPLYS